MLADEARKLYEKSITETEESLYIRINERARSGYTNLNLRLCMSQEAMNTIISNLADKGYITAYMEDNKEFYIYW